MAKIARDLDVSPRRFVNGLTRHRSMPESVKGSLLRNARS